MNSIGQIKRVDLLFTICVVVFQMVVTTTTYLDYQYFIETNEFAKSGLFCGYYSGFELMSFVFIIAVFELCITINILKILGKTLLVLLVVAQILDHYFGVHFLGDVVFNTAWFSAVLAIFVTTILFLKFGVLKLNALTQERKNEK